ncbi:ABC transporter substrate-binding protein [Bradyrhizobium sp. F1.13.3]|uniref:ABC transporter substrate-binding protein n=1 Tax=Bradyrhizobium sp. F1.13.3 TaxID=3156351 RepID=UPI003393C375
MVSIHNFATCTRPILQAVAAIADAAEALSHSRLFGQLEIPTVFKRRSSLSLCLFAIALSGEAHAITIEVLSVPLAGQSQLMDAFKADHPEIDLKLRPPVVNYDDLMQHLLRDRISKTMPDVIFQGFNHSELTVERGLAMPLSPFLNADQEWAHDSYRTNSDELCRHNDKIYGLPFIISVPILYYNADLVRQAGGDPDHLPQTWEKITALAARITALGGNRIGGFFDYASAGNWTFLSLVESQGGRMMSPDNRAIAFNGSEGRRALDIIRDFGKAGQIDMPRDQAYQAFSAGTVGVIVTSSGFLKNLMRQAKFEVRTMALPMADNGRLSAGGNCMMMLAQDPERQKAAWTFMKYMASPAAQQAIAESTGYLPGNSLAIAQLERTATLDDPRNASIRASAKVGEWRSFPGDNSLRITELIQGMLQEVVTLRRTPEQVMPQMTEIVRGLLPK